MDQYIRSRHADLLSTAAATHARTSGAPAKRDQAAMRGRSSLGKYDMSSFCYTSFNGLTARDKTDHQALHLGKSNE